MSLLAILICRKASQCIVLSNRLSNEIILGKMDQLETLSQNVVPEELSIQFENHD